MNKTSKTLLDLLFSQHYSDLKAINEQLETSKAKLNELDDIMNKKESIDNWLPNDKESYFNFLNELKEDKFNNHLSATKKTKSESDVHNSRSIKQKPNYPTINDRTTKHNTKVSKNSPANRTIHLVTDTETTPVNKKKRRHRYHKGRTTKGIIIQSDLVVNLSSYQLTADKLKVLSKGLKFIPTPRNINKTEVLADIKKFGRRMRLNEFFHDREQFHRILNNQTIVIAMMNTAFISHLISLPSPAENLY